MNFNDNFIKKDLPGVLSKAELISYFERCKNGDEEARQIIICHNIRLVLYEVKKHFSNTIHDESDLVSIGLIGLIKSVDTFDLSRNVDFATYSVQCIGNEIRLYLRKDKKIALVDYFDKVLYSNNNGQEILLGDILKDDSMDLEYNYECDEFMLLIREMVESLPERDKTIVKLYFGFVDNKQYSQLEISDMLSLSQSYVSKILRQNLTVLKIKITETGLMNSNLPNNSKRMNRKSL